MTRRLILVRHGRTEDNAAGRMISASDPALDALGREQAERVAEALAGCPAAAVYSSPRRRAVETAEAIARRRTGGIGEEVPIRLDDRLAELGFGAFEGRTEAQIRAAGAGALFEAWRQGVPPRYPAGAESFEEAGQRALAFFSSAFPEAADAIVVGHGHQLRILLAVAVLGAPAPLHRRLRLDHARLAVVEWEGPTPRLALLNVPRLPAL
ncbi:MAG TPA: histidine phosphatase family protein [Thermoanaerobaculia bacterium]|nr:histidine phosphatase family protein [Thermoanaerobaculia bacterium]